MKNVLAAVAFISFAGVVGAKAQSFPSRAITMVVPFAPGGAIDTIPRIMAESMRTTLGQPVVIENTVGAAGSIGVGRVARAEPDGYTLSFGSWSTHVVNGAVHNLRYDLLTDFEPVLLVASQPVLMLLKKAAPASNLKDLITWLKANPDKASMGTAGVGGLSHIAGVYFARDTGTRFAYVPYRGNGPAMQDLIAGQIDLMIDTAASALPGVRNGSILAHAVMAKTRLAAAPEIPTVDEAGAPGLYVSTWYGIWAPKGTPKDVIGKLNAAAVAALNDAAVRKRLTELGPEIPPADQQTPEALGAFHKVEIAKWWPIIKAAGIKAE
jgi:tripartite-type tricarboxylate transporter receptor subunit TctC